MLSFLCIIIKTRCGCDDNKYFLGLQPVNFFCMERLIVWQRYWPDVRSGQCPSVSVPCSSCPPNYKLFVQRKPPVLNLQLFPNLVLSLVTEVPLCQTSCPLRTVHLVIHLTSQQTILWIFNNTKYDTHKCSKTCILMVIFSAIDGKAEKYPWNSRTTSPWLFA